MVQEFSVADELKKLSELRDDGLLSEQEFRAQKSRVLEQSQLHTAALVSGPTTSVDAVAPPAFQPSQTQPPKYIRMTRLRWINVASLLVAAIGLLIAWGNAFFVSISGLDTDDGKVFAVVLLVAALLGWWRLAKIGRLNGCLLAVVWVGILAIAVGEIVHLSSLRDVSVGSGLYLDAAAAILGTVTAVVDTARNWSGTNRL